MKNKNLGLKLGLLVFAIFGFGLSFSSAVNFNLNVEGIKALSKDAIKENMMNIHFADNGNDFGGFFYFSNGSGEDVEGNYEVEASNTNFVCGKQIRGFYYNAERGERLWPLDDQTWQNIPGIRGLDTTGGIYTLCGRPGYVEALEGCKKGEYKRMKDLDYNVCVSQVKNDFPSDGFGYYGQLNQTYSGQEFKLTVGVDYNVPTQNGKFISIKSGSDLKPTFIRINNKYPVGFVYDYNGGVGLAGCKFTNVNPGSMRTLIDKTILNGQISLLNVFEQEGTGIKYKRTDGAITCTGIISTEDTLVKVLVEGIVGLDNHGTGTKFGSLGNTTDTKMQYFGTKTASNVALMNYAAKKAESLCRGKWETKNFPNINNNTKEKTICLSGFTVNAEKAGSARKYGKTLIVKNGDVTINPDGGDASNYYDIFIDGGNLIINESDAAKYVIGTDGFVVGSDATNATDVHKFNVNAFLQERGNDEGYKTMKRCVACSHDEGTFCEESAENNGGCFECEKDPACQLLDLNNNNSIDDGDLSLFLSYEGGGNNNNSSVASVIKGNFIVNGKVIGTGGSVEGKLGHKYFIYGKFTTKSSFSELENVFSWRCENGFGTDGIFCPKFEGNPYRNAAVVVIDQNYGSPLLGS